MGWVEDSEEGRVVIPSITTREEEAAKPLIDTSWRNVMEASARQSSGQLSRDWRIDAMSEHSLDMADANDRETLYHMQTMREMQDREIIAAAPALTALTAGVVGYFNDPQHVMMAAATGGIGGAWSAGRGVLQTGLRIGLTEAAGAAINDLDAMSEQQTKTYSDVALNSGIAFLTAGTLAGGGKFVNKVMLSRAQQQAHEQALREGLTTQSALEKYYQDVHQQQPTSVAVADGAQSHTTSTVSQDGSVPVARQSSDSVSSQSMAMDRTPELTSSVATHIAPQLPQGLTPAQYAARIQQTQVDGGARLLLTSLTPNERLAKAQSLEARELGRLLVGDSFATVENSQGITAPHTSAWRELSVIADAAEGRIMQSVYDAFSKFKKTQLDATTTRQLVDEINAAGLVDEFAELGNDITKALKSRQIFEGLLSHAARNGDQSAFREVASTAANARQINDSLLNDAVAHGVLTRESLDSHLNTATSYFHKSYNKNKIQAKSNEFETLIRDDAMRRGLDPEAAIATGKKFYNDLMSVDDAAAPYAHFGLTSDPLRARTALIRDNDINRFLNNNFVDVQRTWINRVVGETVLAKRGIRGDGSDAIKNVMQSYENIRRDAVANGASASDIKTILNEKDAAVEAIRHFIRNIRGESLIHSPAMRKADTVMTDIRKTAAVVQLPAMLVSSLTDVAAANMKYGMPTQIKLMTKYFKSPEMRQLMREHANEIGVAFEQTTNARLNTMLDITVNSAYQDRNKVQKGIDLLSKYLPVVSQISRWNDFGKTLASTGHAIEASKLLTKNALNKSELQYLSKDGLGFDGVVDWNARVRDQLQKHGDTVDGVLMPNISTWSDSEAANRFSTFLNTKVNTTIVTPTPGTAPLFMQNTGLGKTLMQYQNFTFASHQQLLIAGAQQSKADLGVGLLSFLFMGFAVAQIKHYSRTLEWIEDPNDMLHDAIQYSGIIALPLEINNRLEKLGMPIPTLKDVLGAHESQRTQSWGGPGSAIVGPSWSLGEGVWKVGSDLKDGHLSDKGVKAASKMIPYLSAHFLTKYMVGEVAEAIGESRGPDEDDSQ